MSGGFFLACTQLCEKMIQKGQSVG